MLTNKDAMELSKLLSAPDMFPEARQGITRSLLDYYKELLSGTQLPPVPAVRRMW